MSFQAMAAVARYKARNSTEKLVLFLIANYADEEGSAFPSQERLAQDGSMDVRTVQRTLAALEACDPPAITRERRQRDNGSRTSDRITLLLGRPDRLSGRGERQDDNLSGKAPAHDRGGPGTKSPPEPITDPVEPSTPQPPKGGRARSKAEVSPEAKAVADRLWRLASRECRRKSGQDDTARATAAALARGATADELAVAVLGHCQEKADEDGGKWTKGLHRILEQDRWRAWYPDDPRQVQSLLAAERRLIAEDDPDAPPADDLGTMQAPGLVVQRVWMQDWLDAPYKWQAHVRGPAPTEEGCRISAEVQREFGAEPFAGNVSGGA